MSRRVLPTISGLNPIDADTYRDWGRSAQGQAVLSRVLAGGATQSGTSQAGLAVRPPATSGDPARPASQAAPASPRIGKSLRFAAGRRKATLAVVASAVLLAAGCGAYFLHTALDTGGPVLLIDDPAATQPAQTSATGPVSTGVPSSEALDLQGLWAGNVETVPEKPASLPPEFFTEPAQPAQLVMGEPLWIFAGEVTLAEAAAAVESAPEEQTILLFAPSDELCRALDIPELMSPGSVGELPAIFTQSPLLYREKTFAEVASGWLLVWAQMDSGAGRPAGQPAGGLDPQAVYTAAVDWTMGLDAERRRLEENAQAPADDATTDTTDLYPIPRTVESEQAQALAQSAVAYLENLTGRSLQIEDAAEGQMIGPNDTMDFREHAAMLDDPETGGRLGLSVFWSDRDQMGGFDERGFEGQVSGFPTAWFEAADGSRGYIYANHGYYCRLQLKNGVTAYAETAQTPHGSWFIPPAEASVLTAEQLISFTEWLAGEGEYLRP